MNKSVVNDMTSIDPLALNDSLISLNPRLTHYNPSYKLMAKKVGRNSSKRFIPAMKTEFRK